MRDRSDVSSRTELHHSIFKVLEYVLMIVSQLFISHNCHVSPVVYLTDDLIAQLSRAITDVVVLLV